MIPQFVALGVGLWLIFRESSKKAEQPDDEGGAGLPDYSDEEGIPTPETRPDPSETEWTETASWSGEYAKKGYDGSERVVWILQTGIRYQDGSTEMDSSEYILIGNKSHTAFQSANSDRGTLDIKKEYTGGTSDVKNAIVYPTLQAAIDRVDELSEEPEYDPTDPVQPQPQPEDDDSGSGGGFSFPRQDGFNLGQNIGSYGGL